MTRIIQSPLAVNLPLLSASCYQAALRGLEVQKCAEVICFESRAMSLVRKHIERNQKNIHVDAILGIFLLVETEVSLIHSQ
jgi:hypothetical protein